MTKKKIIIILLVVAVLFGIVSYGIFDNSALGITNFTIKSERLPQAFDGYKIAQISDLHNAQIGEKNEKLINKLASTKPDIIAITGDVVDSRHTDIDVAINFAKKAVKIAPCYYVAGNHEARIENYEDFEKKLEETGVIILNDSQTTLKKGGQTITLAGLKDSTFQSGYTIYSSEEFMDIKLEHFAFDTKDFSILLAHRPEVLDVYAKHGFDLVLSGHTHGGQVRLPFIGCIAAPGQGFFPEYDCGLYQKDNTKMIISRGIGNSMVPIRLNNPPEIVLVTLTK